MARGIIMAATVLASAKGSSVSCSTSHGRAISVNWSPNIEIAAPPNNQRKLIFRNGLSDGTDDKEVADEPAELEMGIKNFSKMQDRYVSRFSMGFTIIDNFLIDSKR